MAVHISDYEYFYYFHKIPKPINSTRRHEKTITLTATVASLLDIQ